MSVYVMSAAWKHGPADRSDLLVLLAIADFADDEGYCWPSMKALAEKARMTERGAQKIIRRLEEQGFVSVSTGSGRKNCNEYQINLRALQKGEQETPNHVHPERRSPRTGEHKPRTGVQETPNGGSPEPSRTVIEPSLTPKSPSAEARATLLEVASPAAVTSFMAYRSKHKGGALTLTAASRLASNLRAIADHGGDPDDALGMAEERNWQTVKPEWYFKEKSHERTGPSQPACRPSHRLDPALENIARIVGLGQA